MAWLPGWKYRKSITLSATVAQTDYQMEVNLAESGTWGGGTNGASLEGHCLSSFADIRFTNGDGSTLLDHWIEETTGSTPTQTATVWVEFDSIATTSTPFYVYYGNDGTFSTSDVTATFIAGTDGAVGSFTSAISGGGATVTYTNGRITLGTSATTLAAGVGKTLSSNLFYTQTTLGELQNTTGNQAIWWGIENFGAVSACLGPSTGSAASSRRLWIYRYAYNAATYPNGYIVSFNSSAGATWYWDGAAWTTTLTRLTNLSGDAECRLYCNGTNFTFDLLQNNVRITSASIASASLGLFNDGKTLFWGDGYTDANTTCATLLPTVDNWIVTNYAASAPTFSAWGTEVELPETVFPTATDPFPIEVSASESLSSVQWNLYTSALCAVEAKVGSTGSTVNTSLDWLLTSAGSYDPGHFHSLLYDESGNVLVNLSGDALFNARTVSSTTISGMTYNWASASENTLGSIILSSDSTIKSRRQGFTQVVPKTSDESISNSTTFQNDNELYFSVDANCVYYFECVLFLDGPAAGDVKYKFTVPSSANIFWDDFKAIADTEVGTGGSPAACNTSAGSQARATAGPATEFIFPIYGIVHVGENADDVRLQWAQNVADTGTTTVHDGSYIKYTCILDLN